MKIVGLGGISGSGKTHLLDNLKNELKDQVSVLSFDNYYKPKHFQQKDENGIENFDLPEGIDSEKFLSDLETIRRGESVKLKVYQFNKPGAEEVYLEVKPAPVLIVEGLFIFHFNAVFSQLDYSIFIDASEETTLKRRLERDVAERGLTEEIVIYQWQNHALPGFEKYVTNYKDKVNLVIENERNNTDAFRTLSEKLTLLIKG